MMTYDFEKNIIVSSLFPEDRVVAGFSTRQNGDARNKENMFVFFKKNNMTCQSLVIPHQIHSVNIHTVDFPPLDSFFHVDDTDGLVTTYPSLMLTVITGDCVPILFADVKNNVIGISHQGWRGTLKKMGTKMLENMEKTGAKKNHIRVAIGPAIGLCCYEVGEETYYEFMTEFEKWEKKIFLYVKGKRHLNLSRLNYLQLVEQGIKPEHIDFFPFCTKCDKKRFFSFRRDDKKEYGEMFSYVMRKN